MAVLTPPSFHNLNLDLVKMQAWAPQQIFATAGDTGYAQVFSLYMNGDSYNDASPETLNFRAIKPDNNVVDIKHEGFQTVSGSSNKFVFTIPEQTFAATGRVECFFYITTTDGKMVASTTHFFYEVQRAMPSETGSISMIATLDDVVKQAHDLYAQAMSTMSEITATKSDTDKQATDFAVDLKQKQADAEKQADQMLADVKAAMDKTAGDATDYQTKLDDLNKQYISKYNELLAKLPDADEAVKQKISDALAQLKIDEQQKFDEIQMDWVKQKETLSTAITTYENSVTEQLDDLKQQISGISSEKVTKLSSDIDALQQKLTSLNLSDYYTKKEIDDKLDSFQPKIDLSGYETTAHAEDTYAKKTDIVAPNLSAYETTDHASETYETKEDAASHLTKTQADATYASKSDIPDVSGFETATHADETFAKKSDIPASQDLSSYETKEHASETYATKQDVTELNLSDFAKSADVAKTYETKADAATHLTKTDADATYAKKDDAKATVISVNDVDAGRNVAFMSSNAQNGIKLHAYPEPDGSITHVQLYFPNIEDYLTKSDAESTYAKKSDVSGGTTTDLSEYLKKTDADNNYAKKSDVSPIKTIHVLPNGWPSDQPGNELKPDANGNIKIDLSQYVYESELSKLLEGYFTCDESDERYAKKSDIPNLSTYLTKTDADADYVAKTDAANFATKDDVKNAVGVRSVSINDGSGSDINVPISRDGALDLNLSSYQQKPSYSYYITKDDADATYAKKGDSTGSGSIDLSDYLKKSDADNDYAKKSDIPNLSTYLTKTDADSTYIKSFKVYYKNQGQTTYQSVTPSNTNLMLMNLLTKTDADADYAKKTDIPTLPDMSTYLTKTDADATYVKKGESSSGSVDLTGYLKKDNLKTIWVGMISAYAKKTFHTPINLFKDGSFDTIYLDLSSDYTFPAINKLSSQYPISDNDAISLSKEAYRAFVATNNGHLYNNGHRILTDADSPASVKYTASSLDSSGALTTQTSTIKSDSGDVTVDLSNFDGTMPCVIDQSGAQTEDQIKTLSQQNHRYVFRYQESFYLGGHKLAFAD